MGHHALWSHETALPPEVDSPARARDFVRRQLIGHHLPYLVEDVRLVVSELATNAMQHARTPFTVRLEQGLRDVVLTVRDGSTSTPVESRPRGTVDALSPGGRGLVIVGQVSRAWGVTSATDGSKSVWATFTTR